MTENVAEIWKEITELDSIYEVSNYGRFRKKDPSSEGGYKLFKLYINKAGYLQFQPYINGKMKVMAAHRVVAKYFLPASQKPQVNHIDGVKTNNAVWNLEWATQQENMDHSKKLGLVARGESHGSSKLKEGQVLAIRRLYRMNPNFRRDRVAKKLGVGHTAILNIVTGFTWRYLLPPSAPKQDTVSKEQTT